MTIRACSICAAPANPGRRRCPRHDGPGTGWSPDRPAALHARWARQVKERDGHRCVMCGNPNELRACHIVPLAQGGSYDLDNGVTRCRACDKATDPYAR